MLIAEIENLKQATQSVQKSIETEFRQAYAEFQSAFEKRDKYTSADVRSSINHTAKVSSDLVFNLKNSLRSMIVWQGISFNKIANYNKAISCFTDPVVLEKATPFVYQNLANSYRKMGELYQARVYFKKAIEIAGFDEAEEIKSNMLKYYHYDFSKDEFIEPKKTDVDDSSDRKRYSSEELNDDQIPF